MCIVLIKLYKLKAINIRELYQKKNNNKQTTTQKGNKKCCQHMFGNTV